MADKGVAGDTFAVAGRGEAGDTVTLFDGKTAIGNAKVAGGGAWSITTAEPLAPGAHSLDAHEVDVAGNLSAFLAGAEPDPGACDGQRRDLHRHAGKDVFTGGPGNDVFEFSAANLAPSDLVKGGGGTNELLMTTPGAVHAGGVSGVASYVLGNGKPDSLSLSNANFAGVASHAITVDGGNAGDVLSEAGVSAADHAVLKGGAGADTLVAGANAL